jgi:C-terminal peptidase prc
MIRTKFALLASLAALLLAVPARAAEKPVQPYVLLVGIDHYADENILPRKHAEADAKALYHLFISKDHMGADPGHIRLLLGKPGNDAQSASRDNILQGLKWLQTSAGKDDLVIFGFFGQGAPVGERLCFFAGDSTVKERSKNAIASGDIHQMLDKLKTRKFVALVDVNFLGFKSGKTIPDANITDLYTVFLGKEDDQGVSPSRTAFFANMNGLKPSLDLKNHGVFAKALLEGLGGKADTNGYEPDGVVTISELAKYVRKEVSDLARLHGKTDAEKDQQPLVLENQSSDFVVDMNPKAFPKAHARLAKFDKLAQDEKFSKQLAEEGHNLLSLMPKLEAKQNLRKVYQKLADGTLTVEAFNEERQTILAGTRISEQEAGKYALLVLRAAKQVREGYVKEVNQGQLVDYAIRGLYRRLGEKLPVNVREGLDRVKSMKEVDLLKLLTEARTHLGKREDLDKGKDVTFSLHTMLGKLDRHTDYIDKETVARMQQDISGTFTGIGVQIKKNNIKDQLQVVTPIKGSPAYKAGLKAGDIITTIVREVESDGTALPSPETIPTKGMTTDQAVKKILGKAGTPIKIIVEREGSAKPLEFNLIRGKVEVESVLGHKRKKDDSWDYVIDPENRICYVRLTQFSKYTYRDLEKTMKKLAKAGIKGFILDLRFNPGGFLDQAVKISDLFIDDGLIVTIRPRNGPETSYIGRSDGSYTTFPMVCLVNGYSASASEIVAACLQDHGRAIILGSRSYGKGSVQTIHSFDSGVLKLTTATYWRPISDPKTGKGNINKPSTQGRDEDEWGVTPNRGFVLKLPTKELNELQDYQRDREIIHRQDRRKNPPTTDFRDRQLDMALEYLRGQIRTAANSNAKKEGS